MRQRFQLCRPREALPFPFIDKPPGILQLFQPMEKIGFVGVGRMGANMARRLKDRGYIIAALYDVNPQSAQTLAQELGAEACAELSQVTKLSDVIITVVTDDKAMKNIYLGGLLSRS